MTKTKIEVRVSPDAKERYIAHASAAGLTLSEWVKSKLDSAEIAPQNSSFSNRLEPKSSPRKQSDAPAKSKKETPTAPAQNSRSSIQLTTGSSPQKQKPVPAKSGTECPMRTARGTKCKFCGKVH